MGKTVKFAENVDSEVKEEVLNVPESVPEDETARDVLEDVLSGQKELSELDDDARDVLIHDFNEKNKGVAELVAERPDQDFIDQCKKDFEEYQSEYLDMTYDIADKDKALEYAKWLKVWNHDYAVAPSSYWIGVLKFEEVIDKIVEDLEKNPDDKLTFDYGALTYTYNLMMQPLGIGYDYAKWMADNQETYNTILEIVGGHVDVVDLIKKKIGLLQNRWALACSGFKCNLLFENLEDLKNLDTSNL